MYQDFALILPNQYTYSCVEFIFIYNLLYIKIFIVYYML
jgi:hypothetical protein